MISYCGGLPSVVSVIFPGVKWHPIKGKMAGLGCFATVGLALYAAVLLLDGVHIVVFLSNPLPTKAAVP